MSAQLQLWQTEETAISSDVRIRLRIRQSRRARRLILQVLPPRTVEVVVPGGVRAPEVRAFIDEHRDWIRRAGEELISAFPEPEMRPSSIRLTALDRIVDVSYQAQPPGSPSLKRRHGALTIRAADEEMECIPALLRRWLLNQGRAHLKQWLWREAELTGLVPSGVQIRLQRTRWGSCSSSGTVSLNAALLLVPAELVRYLLIHELCHLEHMSHSRRYWRAVARLEPNFRELDRRLGQCWTQMPAWLSAGRAC